MSTTLHNCGFIANNTNPGDMSFLAHRVKVSDEITRMLSVQISTLQPRKCLSCGAAETASGTIPCDH